MTGQQMGVVLGAARIAFGLAYLPKPDLAQKSLLGLNPKANETGGYLTRVFGTREFAVGILGTGLLGPQAARAVYRLMVPIEALDATAALIAWRQGKIGGRAATALAAAGLAAVSAGIWATTDAG